MNRFIIVKQLDGSEHQYDDKDLPLTLGSNSESHIHVPGIEAAAAFVSDSRGHLFVQTAEHCTKPVFHNGCHLTGSVWLKSGDSLVCESHQITYERSGDRAIFTVFSIVEADKATSATLIPPEQPPPEDPSNSDSSEEIPVTVALNPKASRRKKTLLSIILLTFLLLSCGVLFVLFARPLELVISPEPDSVSVSGFPPAVKLGGSYLALPGAYKVTADKEGYIAYEKEIQVGKASTNRIEADLVKQPGILNLVLRPADGVQIYLGGELLGTTPPYRFKVGAGNHQLRLSKQRYQATSIDIDVEGRGFEQTIEASLQPDWAEMTIVSEPSGARLYIDGVASGSTPATKEVLSGNRMIELKKDLYIAKTDSIEVTAGLAATHRFSLELLPGQFSLASLPSGAVVTLNNSYQGVTPLSLSLKANESNDIRLSHPGYRTMHHTVRLGPGEEKTQHLELEQAVGVVFFTITPARAKVVINGKSYTSLQGKLVLPAVPQKIEVSSPGYKSVLRSITPNPGFSQQVTVDLVSRATNVAADSGITKSSKVAVPAWDKN